MTITKDRMNSTIIRKGEREGEGEREREREQRKIVCWKLTTRSKSIIVMN